LRPRHPDAHRRPRRRRTSHPDRTTRVRKEVAETAQRDWTDAEGKPVAGTTAWLIDPQENNHFAPGSAPFMVNYRVEDLHALVKALKEEGCNVLEKIDESEYGKFAWVIDPEGNKVELWQPPQGQ
jgi:uncharacterized glyoxalase superfamily protein PhnB